jgi:hypothetical protein
MPALSGIALLALGVLIGVLIGIHDWNGTRGRMKRELDYFKKTFPQHQGGTILIPNANYYRVVSVDSGKTWISFDHQGNVMGWTNDVQPGLIDHIEAMNRFKKYVEENGPINPMSNEGVRMLERAGFKMVKE